MVYWFGVGDEVRDGGEVLVVCEYVYGVFGDMWWDFGVFGWNFSVVWWFVSVVLGCGDEDEDVVWCVWVIGYGEGVFDWVCRCFEN